MIPTIHLIDLGRVVRRICDEKITKNYIFAVDRTKKPTQKRITQAISTGVGTGKIKYLPESGISDSIMWKNLLTVNLKIKTSDVFKDNEPPEDQELDDKELEKLKFPWHC